MEKRLRFLAAALVLGAAVGFFLVTGCPDAGRDVDPALAFAHVGAARRPEAA